MTDLTPLFALEDRLEAAITVDKSGGFDGDEIAVGGADDFFYMYGPDADRLLATILPILEAVPFMKGAQATKRYGPPDPGVRTVVHVINQWTYSLYRGTAPPKVAVRPRAVFSERFGKLSGCSRSDAL